MNFRAWQQKAELFINLQLYVQAINWLILT